MVTAVENAIKATVPIAKPSRYSKRWWNKDLDDMHKVKNRPSKEAHGHRDEPGHAAHQDLREWYRNTHSNAILEAKETHWTNFLEEADETTLWTAGRYINNPNGEGAARPRIPTLRTTNPDGSVRLHKSNAEKADLLATTFFPPPLPLTMAYLITLFTPLRSLFMQNSQEVTSVALPPNCTPTRLRAQIRSPTPSGKNPLTS